MQKYRRYVAGTKYGHLTGPLWAFVKMTVDTLLANFGFKKVKNLDGVCKTVHRYVAGTKNGHLTVPLWACVKMTVDTLLANFGFKKVKNPDGVCKKVRRYVAGPFRVPKGQKFGWCVQNCP